MVHLEEQLNVEHFLRAVGETDSPVVTSLSLAAIALNTMHP